MKTAAFRLPKRQRNSSKSGQFYRQVKEADEFFATQAGDGNSDAKITPDPGPYEETEVEHILIENIGDMLVINGASVAFHEGGEELEVGKIKISVSPAKTNLLSQGFRKIVMLVVLCVILLTERPPFCLVGRRVLIPFRGCGRRGARGTVLPGTRSDTRQG